ncbi:MAG: YitT family protein [Alphaproteobacteria bacterium]|nr:YitT family protein [Alphaproteobacteria bacterium]
MPKFLFLSVKSIPVLFWSSSRPLNFQPRLITLIFLVFGLLLFGLGEAILIAASIGVSPWTVLALGVSNVTSLSIGASTFLISVMVLLFWIPLKQMPGIGTILNVIIIAIVLEYIIPYLPNPKTSFHMIIQALIGVLVTGIGSAIYLISNLGPGPRDGLMTGLQKLTNLTISMVRSSIEVTVVIIGWFLGGPVGLGTLLFAFLIGPAVATNIYILNKIFNIKYKTR